ncbi:MAG: DUF3048 domain-containing protein [Actinomycetota bacterium]
MSSRISTPSRRALGAARLLAVLLCAAIVATACGGGGDDDTEEAVVDETTTTTEAASAAAVDEDDDDVEPDDGEIELSPPTVRGPAPTLDVEPVEGYGLITVISGEPLYGGLIAQLDADRNIVQAVALPPEAVPGTAPLTGLPLADDAIADRPAIVAKVDNTASGRPQEALSQADLVYVTQIEGGFTRLAAVYHSQTPEVLGPIRSGRTTDITVFSSFDTPIFAWSGANRVQLALIRRYEMLNYGAATRSEYFRADDRPGTYDLMTDPSVLWEIAAGEGAGGTPPAHFEYRDDTTGLPTSAEPAASFRIDYASATMEYAWNGTGWLRTQNGEPHVDADGIQLAPENVVVAEVRRVDTGTRDTAGSAVIEQQFVGSGRGWVFTDGHVVQVVWTKPSLNSVATWTTPDGVPVHLTPGQTWIELAPVDSVTLG